MCCKRTVNALCEFRLINSQSINELNSPNANISAYQIWEGTELKRFMFINQAAWTERCASLAPLPWDLLTRAGHSSEGARDVVDVILTPLQGREGLRYKSLDFASLSVTCMCFYTFGRTESLLTFYSWCFVGRSELGDLQWTSFWVRGFEERRHRWHNQNERKLCSAGVSMIPQGVHRVRR